MLNTSFCCLVRVDKIVLAYDIGTATIGLGGRLVSRLLAHCRISSKSLIVLVGAPTLWRCWHPVRW